MRIKEIVRAPKSGVVCDGWKAGRMPSTVFPLGKSGKHSLNFRAHDWCRVRFSANGAQFLLLVAVNFGKEDYYAFLGRVMGSDSQMLASYEFHGTHPGWHVHAGCGDTTLIPVGRFKGDWKRKIPKHSDECRKKIWDVPDKDTALARAYDVFGLPPPSKVLSGQMGLI